ncbi:TetR/AcrR family transcriptional regulator [Subtercola vilae]|uniref:TetR/AcrR family transcriptional regulator n=1 Tax=Subtercola vilae TaxID=2056433 RepID=A0A4T2C3U8_9MICO|nr:TetR/AcrR family transcriptional regulator [Subtercola vilae]
MVEKRVNPRVERTKTRVLEVAHELLDELGPAGLTYTSLASRSGVTRQTIYQHWPERDALLADVILTGPDVGYPVAGPDARIIVIDFLASLRDDAAGRSERTKPMPSRMSTPPANCAGVSCSPSSSHA